ncbi:hypothetical protein KIPB_013067, partial [Kipferlia bialata]
AKAEMSVVLEDVSLSLSLSPSRPLLLGAKAEMSVVLEDGFESLCGYRSEAEVIETIYGGASVAGSTLRAALKGTERDIKSLFEAYLSPEVQASLVSSLSDRGTDCLAGSDSAVDR